MTDLGRIRKIRVRETGKRSSRTVVVTDAGRARVIESAQESNKARERARTQAILDAAAKAKSA